MLECNINHDLVKNTTECFSEKAGVDREPELDYTLNVVFVFGNICSVPSACGQYWPGPSGPSESFFLVFLMLMKLSYEREALFLVIVSRIL